MENKSLLNGVLVFLITLVMSDLNLCFRLKLTKLECESIDKKFINVETCRLKAESRDVQFVAIKLNLLQVPITSASGRFRILKRANGFKPFLYDFTWNCGFIKHLNAVTSILWTWFKEVSNLNHSCPLTDDFEIKRLENRYLEKQLQVLPIPLGDYAFFTNFSFYNIPRFRANFYGTIF